MLAVGAHSSCIHGNGTEQSEDLQLSESLADDLTVDTELCIHAWNPHQQVTDVR